MRAGDYAIAYFIWKPMADDGDANAQFNLGWMYHNGYGLTINNEKALMWWQQAANQGLASASFALGMLLSHGDRQVVQNRPAALQHYITAATLGHDDAREMILHLRKESAHENDELDAIIGRWGKKEWQLVGTAIHVTAPKANVRAGPGTDHAVVTVLHENDEVIRISNRNRWLEVFLPHNGVIAWLHDSLVKAKSR
jgi:TPR repeat protein